MMWVTFYLTWASSFYHISEKGGGGGGKVLLFLCYVKCLVYNNIHKCNYLLREIVSESASGSLGYLCSKILGWILSISVDKF